MTDILTLGECKLVLSDGNEQIELNVSGVEVRVKKDYYTYREIPELYARVHSVQFRGDMILIPDVKGKKIRYLKVG